MRELGEALLECDEQRPLRVGNILSRRNLTGRGGVPYARRLRVELREERFGGNGRRSCARAIGWRSGSRSRNAGRGDLKSR
jgi:hypothetical protein